MQKNGSSRKIKYHKLLSLCPNNKIILDFESLHSPDQNSSSKQESTTNKKKVSRFFKSIKSRISFRKTISNKVSFACTCKKVKEARNCCATVFRMLDCILNKKNLIKISQTPFLSQKLIDIDKESDQQNTSIHELRTNKDEFDQNPKRDIVNESIVSQVDNTGLSLKQYIIDNSERGTGEINNSFVLQGIDDQTTSSFTIKLKKTFFQKESSKIGSMKDIIHKDVKRTFQSVPYFNQKATKKMMEELLFDLTKEKSIGYVQGMNYLAASVLFHCNDIGKAHEICSFIIDKMEMFSVYSYTALTTHITIFKELLSTHCKKVFIFCEETLKLDYLIYLIDLYFCLFFNKIPLDYSHLLLEQYVQQGWFFFYKLILSYYKYFEKKYLSKKNKLDKLGKLDLELLFKNFYKKEGFPWKEIINSARAVKLDRAVIKDKLNWTYFELFEKD